MARRSTSRSTESGDDIVVGVVRAPHGVRGEVRVEPLTDRYAARFHKGAKLVCEGVGEVVIEGIRGTEQQPVVHFRGYADRDAAAALRNKELRIPRGEARRAAGEGYLWSDLIGLEVATPDGRALGKVVEVIRAGETDVLVARGAAGEVMLPALESVVREVDLVRGRVVAVPQEELG